jgi:hypothetical protein
VVIASTKIMNVKTCDVCRKDTTYYEVFSVGDISHVYCLECLEEKRYGAVRRRGQSFVEAKLKEHGVWCRFKKFFTK